MDEIEKNNGEIIIYRTEDGRTQLEVRLENENVWLSQQQIANLFGVQRPAITKHLKNIFEIQLVPFWNILRAMEKIIRHSFII